MTALAQFREKFPKYSGLSDYEVSQGMHAFYEQETGDSIDFADFSKRFGVELTTQNIDLPPITGNEIIEQPEIGQTPIPGIQTPDLVRQQLEPKPPENLPEKKTRTSLAVGGADLDFIEPGPGALSVGGAGLAQGTLELSEATFRTPNAINRWLEYVNDVGRNLGVPDALLRPVFDNPLEYLDKGIDIGGFHIAGMGDVANRIQEGQEILTENFSPFRKLAEIGQESSDAVKELVQSGNSDSLRKVLFDPKAWAGAIGQAVPSLVAAYASGGSLGFIGWLEGMSMANDVAEYEDITGKQVTPQEFTQAQAQAATINAVLERAGLDSILKGMQGTALGAVKAGTGEAFTEVAQEFNSNLAKKLSFDEDQELTEGLLMAMMGGAGAGTGAAVAGQIQAQQEMGRAILKDVEDGVAETTQEAFETRIAPPKPSRRIDRNIDPVNDDLFAAIAKLGGISRQEAEAQGIDPAEFKRRGFRILPVFTKNGRSLDDLQEVLSGQGFQVSTANELLDRVSDQLAGNIVRTPQGVEANLPEDPFDNELFNVIDEDPEDVTVDDYELAGLIADAQNSGLDYESLAERFAIENESLEDSEFDSQFKAELRRAINGQEKENAAKNKGNRTRRKVGRPGTKTAAKEKESDESGNIEFMAWNPGDDFVPLLHGSPIPAVEIPKKPWRREAIVKEIEKQFGAKIYQGRVKGKSALGFHKKDTNEIRIKRHNDLEIVAHEFAHWLDDRNPAFKASYERFKDEMQSVSYDKSKLNEGFAEFVRLYMTQESEALSRAPKFYDQFEATLKELKLFDKIQPIKTAMHQWYYQGALNRFKSKVGAPTETLSQRMRGIADGFSDKSIQNVFDFLHGLKAAEQNLRGTIGDASTSPYKLARLASGSRSTTKAVLEHGTISYAKNGDIIFSGEGLRQVFSDVTGDLENALTYFAAKRAQELTKQGRENLWPQDEINAGLALAKENPGILKAHNRWKAFSKRMMDFYQQSGLVSAEGRLAMEKANAEWVPFYRVIEEVTGNRITQGNPFKRLKGGTQNVNDLLDNIGYNIATMVDTAMKNRAKLAFFDMVENSKLGANYAVKIAKDTKQLKIPSSQVVDTFLKAAGYSRADLQAGILPVDVQLMVKQVEGELSDFAEFFVGGQAPRGNNIESVRRNGKTEFYEIGDPLVYKSFLEWNHKPIGMAMRMLSGFKRALTYGVTAAPDFLIPNLIRDTMSGFVLSKGGIIPGASSIKGMVDRLRNDPSYWEFMANGGGFSSSVHAEINLMRDKLDKFYVGKGINPRTVLRGPADILEFWQEFASAFEYGTRLAEFNALKKKGETLSEATFQGKEVSTDFSMRGRSDFLKFFVMSVPFLNARLQGMYRLGRGAKMDTKQFALRGLSALTLPSILLYLMNRDDERYKALEDWDKDLHWHIFVPGVKDWHIRIPKPFEVGAIFATLPERITELTFGKDGDKFGEAMAFMLAETFALNPTPQAIKPIVETEISNKRFTGGPVIPEDLKYVRPSEQFQPWSSETAKQVGELFNISPIKLEHWMRGYLGYLGQYILMSSDALIQDDNLPAPRLDESIVLRRLMRQQPYRNSQYEQEFWKLAGEVREAVETMKKIRSEFRGEDLKKFTEQNSSMIGINTLTQSVIRKNRALNNASRQIMLSDTMTGDEKRKALDEILKAKTELFKEINAGSLRKQLKEIVE